MVEVDTAEVSDLPHMDHVVDAALGECIAKADSAELRLPRGYRSGALSIIPTGSDTDSTGMRRRLLPKAHGWRPIPTAAPVDKLRRRKAPSYSRPVGSPFTYPAFNPTDEQLQNMQRLSEMLEDWRKGSPKVDLLELADLYRVSRNGLSKRNP